MQKQIFLKKEKFFFLEQYIKNNKLISETDKSLKKGPVIKKKGINENKITGKLNKINFSMFELNFID